MDYSIIFAGRIEPGHVEQEVRASLGRRLRIAEPAKVDKLFSGREVVLKSGLSAEQAEQYRAALAKAGVSVEVRNVSAPVAPLPVKAEPDPFAAFGDDVSAVRPTATAAAVPPPPAAKPGSALDGITLAPVERPAPEPAPQPAVARATAPQSPVRAPSAAGRQAPDTDYNGSGEGANSSLPDDVRKVCPGGFLMFFVLPLGVVWGLRYRAYVVALLGLVPLVNIGMAIYILFRGNEIAWRNRKWASEEEFFKEQRVWSILGVAVLALTLYRWNRAFHKAQQQMAMAATPEGLAERDAAQQRTLDQIKDPAQREKMKEFFDAMNKLSAASAHS